ncbi:hypothetical protein JCM17960_00220 [Magnetospira thiophila]
MVRGKKTDWKMLSDTIFAGEPFDLRLTTSNDIQWQEADLLVWAPGGDVALKLPVNIASNGSFQVPHLKKPGLHRLQVNAAGVTSVGDRLNRVFDRTIDVQPSRPKVQPVAPKPVVKAAPAPPQKPLPKPVRQPTPAAPSSDGWQSITD